MLATATLDATHSELRLRASRRLAFEAARLASRARIQALRLQFPSLEIDSASFVGPGCQITCADGGRGRLLGSYIGRGSLLFIDRDAELEIVGARIGPNSVVAAHESVTIDPGCSFAEMVVIRDHDHIVDATVRLDDVAFVTSPVRICSRVWIGAKATVLRGVTVSEDAVIAAHSVVRCDVEPRAVYAGVPAVRVR
jgi:acetyltransferase-like isoleucine patch superfamily enzyme